MAHRVDIATVIGKGSGRYAAALGCDLAGGDFTPSVCLCIALTLPLGIGVAMLRLPSQPSSHVPRTGTTRRARRHKPKQGTPVPTVTHGGAARMIQTRQVFPLLRLPMFPRFCPCAALAAPLALARNARQRIRLVPALTILALTVLVAVPASSWAGEDPTSQRTPGGVVERLHAALIEAMKIGKQGGYRQRVSAIEQDVLECYDFPVVGRVVLGEHWERLEADERDRFLDVFRRYVVSNYAAEFDSYNGHYFRTVRSEEQRPGLAVVRSILTTGTGAEHRFDYQLRRTEHRVEGRTEERWRIVGVAVDGVSNLALQRSQYTAVIDKDGFSALIMTLEEKIRGFARGETGDG